MSKFKEGPSEKIHTDQKIGKEATASHQDKTAIDRSYMPENLRKAIEKREAAATEHSSHGKINFSESISDQHYDGLKISFSSEETKSAYERNFSGKIEGKEDLKTVNGAKSLREKKTENKLHTTNPKSTEKKPQKEIAQTKKEKNGQQDIFAQELIKKNQHKNKVEKTKRDTKLTVGKKNAFQAEKQADAIEDIDKQSNAKIGTRRENASQKLSGKTGDLLASKNSNLKATGRLKNMRVEKGGRIGLKRKAEKKATGIPKKSKYAINRRIYLQNHPENSFSGRAIRTISKIKESVVNFAGSKKGMVAILLATCLGLGGMESIQTAQNTITAWLPSAGLYQEDKTEVIEEDDVSFAQAAVDKMQKEDLSMYSSLSSISKDLSGKEASRVTYNGRALSKEELKGKSYDEYEGTFVYYGSYADGSGGSNNQDSPNFQTLTESQKKGEKLRITMCGNGSTTSEVVYSGAGVKQYLGRGSESLDKDGYYIAGWSFVSGTNEQAFSRYETLSKSTIESIISGHGNSIRLYAIYVPEDSCSKEGPVKVVTEEEYKGDLSKYFSSDPITIQFAYVDASGDAVYTEDESNIASGYTRQYLYKAILAAGVVATDNDVTPEKYINYCVERMTKVMEGVDGYSVEYNTVRLDGTRKTKYGYEWQENGKTVYADGARLTAKITIYVDITLDAVIATDEDNKWIESDIDWAKSYLDLEDDEFEELFNVELPAGYGGADYVAIAIALAADDSIGYSQATRYHNPNMDCSSFVYYSLLGSSYGEQLEQICGTAFSTSWMGGVLQQLGFTQMAFDESGLQYGDIIVTPGSHTEIYAGNGMDVAAHSNYDGVDGDSSGREVCLASGVYHGTYIYRPPVLASDYGAVSTNRIEEEWSEGSLESSAVYQRVQAQATWSGTQLTRRLGTVEGPSGKETYYNLSMTNICENYLPPLGITGHYWVRSDGCKMWGNYIMLATDTYRWPKGSIYEVSLGMGIVVDHCASAQSYSGRWTDIAVAW